MNRICIVRCLLRDAQAMSWKPAPGSRSPAAAEPGAATVSYGGEVPPDPTVGVVTVVVGPVVVGVVRVRVGVVVVRVGVVRVGAIRCGPGL
jgi:hypothetical protein